MRLAVLAIVAFVLGFTGDARAGGNVDWSAYIDKDGSAPLPKSTTPNVVVAEEDEAPAAKPTKRVAKSAKAKKTSKAKAAKAKTRAKAKKRRK